MNKVRPQCTNRFVVDVGHRCNINCKFCYHRHEGDLTKASFKDRNYITDEIGKGISRGNTWCDFTGGEPTLYPDIYQFIELLYKKEVGSTIITNGVVSEHITERLLGAGLSEFLISIHGTDSTHDFLAASGVRFHQNEFLSRISDRIPIRFNFVINQFNQKEIYETAMWMSQWQPLIVNFINFNPHHGWRNNLEDAESIVPGLFIVEDQLNRAIKFLEDHGVGVNVRYYPMCRIAEEYRRCICNDLHVIFDPYEWDYCMPVKTTEKYLQWGVDATHRVENKDFPCNECDLQWICGGANKYFLEVTGNDCLTQQQVDFTNYEDRFYFYYYRQYNSLTLNHKSIEAVQ